MTTFAVSAPFDRVSGNVQDFVKLLSAPVQAGSVLWALCMQYSATNTCDTVTDDLGGTWVRSFGPIRSSTIAGMNEATIYGWYKLNSAVGGAPTNGTITASWSASAQGTMVVGEVRGLLGGGSLAAGFGAYVQGFFAEISYGVTPSLPIGAAGVMFSTAPGSDALAAPHTPFVVDSIIDASNFERAYRTITTATGSIDAGLTPAGNSNNIGGALFFADAVTLQITGPSGSAGAANSTANLAENATTGPTFTTNATLGGGFPTLTGTDAALFTVATLSSTSWRVDPVSAFNFESLPHSNPFNVVFNASGSLSQACAITITGVNEAPTFSGTISVPTLTQLTGMSAINVASLFADPDSGDTGTYSTIGSWPSGVTVNASGIISGTPVVSGIFSNLRVRRTDGGGLTADSNLFTITITASAGSVTTEPLENSNGSLCASVTVHYSWYPNGRIGSLAGITPQEGSATTNASGQLTATGLIAGPGVLFTDYRQVSQTNDVVHYHVLTAA